MTSPRRPDPDDQAPPAEAGPRDCSAPARGMSHRTLSVAERVEWQLPEEEPAALVYNRRSFAVMLISPADLEDFGLGFSLSERVIAAPSRGGRAAACAASKAWRPCASPSPR